MGENRTGIGVECGYKSHAFLLHTYPPLAPVIHALFTLQVPGLADGWNDVKEKCTVVTEDFKVLILEQHAKKKAEHEDWLAVVKVMEGMRGRGMCLSHDKANVR